MGIEVKDKDLTPLQEVALRFVGFYSFLEALFELDGEEPLKDSDVVLSISGAGASDALTAGAFRELEQAVYEELTADG